MAAIHNLDELKGKLNQPGTLSQLLTPQDFAAEGLVAETMAKSFKGKLKPTQMRKVFHSFKQIERRLRASKDEEAIRPELQAEISLQVPNLAYAVGRELLPKDFYDVLKLCLHQEKIKTAADVRRLNQLLTAILAYQKYYEKERD